jgi:DNA polymerase-3 subunit gamma/tau
MSEEFYKKYRPKNLDGVIGQPAAVAQIRSWGENVPQAILLSGPSGCGKTTLARILRGRVGCHPLHDFFELNCADERGIDTVRQIARQMRTAALKKSKMWLIDEAHKLTGDAQNAFLKILEDTPPDVYIVLATTDPEKLIATVRNRCTEIRLSVVSESDLKELVSFVAEKAGFAIDGDVADKIIDAAEGSPRRALVLLNQIAHVESAAEQLKMIQHADQKRDAIEICRALMNARTAWPDMAKILKEVKIDEPEQIRRLIRAYCSSILLSGKPAGRAAMILDFTRTLWYDRGDLIFAAWEILGVK